MNLRLKQLPDLGGKEGFWFWNKWEKKHNPLLRRVIPSFKAQCMDPSAGTIQISRLVAYYGTGISVCLVLCFSLGHPSFLKEGAQR